MKAECQFTQNNRIP